MTKGGNEDQDARGVVEMPFGKYKGLLLEDVPEDYLKWLLEGNKIKSFALRGAVYQEWSWRQHQKTRREVRGSAAG